MLYLHIAPRLQSPVVYIQDGLPSFSVPYIYPKMEGQDAYARSAIKIKYDRLLSPPRPFSPRANADSKSGIESVGRCFINSTEYIFPRLDY